MKQPLNAVMMSDSHSEIPNNLKMPPGDIFFHCGDSTKKGTVDEIKDFFNWLSLLPYKYKVIIAGNHDHLFADKPDLARKMLPKDVIYLEDSGIDLLGWNIYGSPVTPRAGSSAFSRLRGQQMRQHWRYVPSDTDILLTHCPPAGILDTTAKGESAGCESLRHKVMKVQPKYHFFGHIHNGFGKQKLNNTTFCNVAYLNKYHQTVTELKIIP